MKRDITVINKIDFATRNLTSNTGLFLILENAKINLKYPKLLFLFNKDVENVSDYSVLRNCLRKYVQDSKTMLNFRNVPTVFPPGLGENDGKFISTLESRRFITL